MPPRRTIAGLVTAAVCAIVLALLVARVLVPMLLPEPPPRPARSQPASAPTPVELPRTETPAPPPAEPVTADAGSREDVEAAPLPPPPRSLHKRAGLVAGRDVTRLGPGRYRIRRATLDEALAKGGAGGTRARPVVEQGRIIGYRLGGVSQDLRRLGLRSGDIVTTVNGLEVDSPDAALRAYGNSRKASRIVVGLRRRGGRVGLRYDIVE